MNIGVFILCLAIFLTIIFVPVIIMLKKTAPKKADTSTTAVVETAQDFLPFEEIHDNVLDLGDFSYRAYIEVSSLNYFLRTEDEQDIIEMTYKRFINSLSHPIAIFIQTRAVDKMKILNSIKKDYQETALKHPKLKAQSEANYAEMEELYDEMEHNREKRKFIIVPYDEAFTLTATTDQERHEYAMEETLNRARLVADQLNGAGVSCRLMNTREIAELIFSTYHRDNYQHLESVLNGDYDATIVEGDTPPRLSDDQTLDWILYEAQLRLQKEIFDFSNDDWVRAQARQAISELNAARKVIAAQNKQRPVKSKGGH